MAAPRLIALQESRRKKVLPIKERPLLAIPSSSNQPEDTEIISESHGSRVERVGNVVLKYGGGVDYSEFDAQQIAVEQLKIPVPRVYDCQTHLNGTTGISMEYVAGDTLWDLYPSMSKDQKLNVAHQLRDILIAMRSLKPDADMMIGSCGNRPARDLRTVDFYRGGPFSDEDGFNDFLTSEVFPATPKILVKKFRQKLRNDHRIVFTHADLNQRNIIIRDDKVVALLDWQFAGWYPEYWEYIKFFGTSPREKDWLDYADAIFPQSYDDELFLHQFLARYHKP